MVTLQQPAHILLYPPLWSTSFFFNDTATTEIYTLSLHDALPICWWRWKRPDPPSSPSVCATNSHGTERLRRNRWHSDRKSTRLNSSHSQISYAVFCLKKKKKTSTPTPAHAYRSTSW